MSIQIRSTARPIGRGNKESLANRHVRRTDEWARRHKNTIDRKWGIQRSADLQQEQGLEKNRRRGVEAHKRAVLRRKHAAAKTQGLGQAHMNRRTSRYE